MKRRLRPVCLALLAAGLSSRSEDPLTSTNVVLPMVNENFHEFTADDGWVPWDGVSTDGVFYADVQLNPHPDRPVKQTISNILFLARTCIVETVVRDQGPDLYPVNSAEGKALIDDRRDD